MDKPSIALRRLFKTDYSDLSAFAANARLLQSIWRHENNIPHRADYYGNFIDGDNAYTHKFNLLSDRVKGIVEKELIENEKASKSNRKVIKKDRLYENLLASQPLAFNLFAEFIDDDFKIATSVFQKILPSLKISKVVSIEFEISPGRSNIKYTGDKSAFDVFVTYESPQGKGFIGIEVKYAETLLDIPASFRERYRQVARQSQLFSEEGIEALSSMPRSIEQIWRDHLLSLSMRPPVNADYSDGMFIYLFPRHNFQCAEALANYSQYLKSAVKTTDKMILKNWRQHLFRFWVDGIRNGGVSW